MGIGNNLSGKGDKQFKCIPFLIMIKMVRIYELVNILGTIIYYLVKLLFFTASSP